MMHLRPRGFSELIDATFEIVRARFRVLATTAALVMVPVMAFTLLSVLANPDSANPALGGGTTASAGGPVVVATSGGGSTLATILILPVMVIAFVTYVIGFGAMMYIASRAYMGEAVEAGPALARARARFWTLVRATLAKYIRAVGPVILIGIAAAVAIPAIASGGGAVGGAIVIGVLLPVLMVWSVILLLRYAVTGPVVINEDVTGSGALKRSATLTHGSKWRLFGMFALLFVIMYTVMLTVLFASTVIFRSVLVAQVLMNVSSLVTYPVAAVLISVVYYDLRIRNEGFDLEMMAGGLGDDAVLPTASTPARLPA